MTTQLPRFLLAVSAVMLALGGIMHARAFDKATAVVAASNLPAFYADSLKALWLIDSATLIVLALVFGLVAARPVPAFGAVIVLLALIPATTAAFQYTFLGMFLPAHIFSVAAAMAILAGLLLARG
jgi:uncharacterized membrane protein